MTGIIYSWSANIFIKKLYICNSLAAVFLKMKWQGKKLRILEFQKGLSPSLLAGADT
jgi:hypothetical protein